VLGESLKTAQLSFAVSQREPARLMAEGDLEGKLMAFDIAKIYDEYCAMCERCGITPAPYDRWRLLSKS
jgi:hypothetical protein